jgi:hypothetical protein
MAKRQNVSEQIEALNLLELEMKARELLQEFPDGTAGSGLAPYIASLFDPALTWKVIEWLAGITNLPVLVKGILRSDDALLAALPSEFPQPAKRGLPAVRGGYRPRVRAVHLQLSWPRIPQQRAALFPQL